MARIVSVADTFDAMTTDRPYQQALKFEDAVERIKGFVGTRYDARVVAAFVAACEDGTDTPRFSALEETQQWPSPDGMQSASLSCRPSRRRAVIETLSVS